MSGTSQPQSLYADVELTTALPNPLVLDSSGEATYFYGPFSYKLALHDAQDVPQWVIDPVPGTGGGGAAAAGMGMGSNTVELHPGASTAQAGAVVFPATVLALGLTVWVEETFGTAQGLTHLGIGTVEHPDCWGVLTELTAATQTHAGVFLGYSGHPMPGDGTVTLTAYGGHFDGTGAVYLTGHFATFHPSHALGLTWTPPGPPSPEPPAPQPYATETSPGVVELVDATEVLQDTETTHALTIARLVSRTGTPSRLGLLRTATPDAVVTGTNDTDAATPLGVAQALAPVIAVNTTQSNDIAALDAKIPAGTPLSVVRYASGGTALESSPLTLDAAGAGTWLVNGAQPVMTWSAEHTTTTAGLIVEAYQPGTGSGSFTFRKAVGTRAAPGRVTATNVGAGNLTGAVWARDAADAADGWQLLGRLGIVTESVDAQGRVGGAVTVLTSPGVSAAMAEVARFTQGGALLVGLTTPGTGLTKGLGIASGTAPSTSPADAVQLWTADRGATAGKASLHVRTEDGTTHVLGDLAGIGTTLSATLGSGAAYQALSVKGGSLHVGQSSTQERPIALIAPSFTVSTDATRQGRLSLNVYDSVAAREVVRMEADGTTAKLSFFAATAVAKPTVSGSRGGNAALASALTALASLGLITDSSSA